MSPLRTILYPTDFSDCSRYAFQLATTLALEHKARLVVLHVNQPLGPMPADRRAMPHLQPEAYQQWLRNVLGRFQVPAATGVTVEHRLVEGQPVREILRTAGETGCDLIVMGTHGRTGLDLLILGSVAEQVLRKARCPVVTVKLPRRSGAVTHSPAVTSTPEAMASPGQTCPVT